MKKRNWLLFSTTVMLLLISIILYSLLVRQEKIKDDFFHCMVFTAIDTLLYYQQTQDKLTYIRAVSEINTVFRLVQYVTDSDKRHTDYIEEFNKLMILLGNVSAVSDIAIEKTIVALDLIDKNIYDFRIHAAIRGAVTSLQ